MGGSADAEGNVSINAEFNFWFDAEAAHVVINRANCLKKIVPWETCIEKKIDWVHKYLIKSLIGQGIHIV
jgi:inosine-uridine nucleoside N-ribohydrolase